MHLTPAPTHPAYAVHAQVDSASDCYIAAVGFLREDSIISTGLQASFFVFLVWSLPGQGRYQEN